MHRRTEATKPVTADQLKRAGEGPIEGVDATPFSSVGARLLREAQKRSGCTVARFAKRLGVHKATVFRWFRGESIPTTELAVMLQARLGIPVPAWGQADEPKRKRVAS